jgi:hypothetical protein
LDTKRKSMSSLPLPLRVLGALLAFGAALAATFVAGVLDWLACESGTCFREGLAHLQFVVALAGLVPTVILVVAFLIERSQLTRWSLGISLVTYLAWALLADAAHHGWDNLKLFPF